MRMRKPLETPLNRCEWGAPIWERTSLIQPYYPQEAFVGTWRPEAQVYFVRLGQLQRRKWLKPKDPKTCFQLPRRELWRQILRYWSHSEEMSLAQRDQWQGYALRHFWPECSWRARNVAGMNAFERVHVVRLPLGMGFLPDPPREAPPARALELTQEPASAPDALAFRLRHGQKSLAGAFVLVEATEAMPTPRRKPCENQYKWACGETRSSFLELKASGESYELLATRFHVEAGRRYGLRVQLVSAQGVPGPRLCGDFVKELRPEAVSAGAEAGRGAAFEARELAVPLSQTLPLARVAPGAGRGRKQRQARGGAGACGGRVRLRLVDAQDEGNQLLGALYPEKKPRAP